VTDDWQLDRDLLARWRDGDARAGEQLYTRHVDAVIKFFRNKLPGDPQDLVQETFLRLVAGRERIRDGQALRAYVLGIAWRVWVEHLRKRAQPRPIDVEIDAVADVVPGPSTIAAKQHEHRLMLEALRRLPIQQQILLELYYWERLKHDELAEMMGISTSAMRSRVAKARERLAAELAKLADEPGSPASTQTNVDDWAETIRREYLPDKHD
jgi:RNA polymerase sigma-70 factor (ECF subfamily)